MLGKGAGEKKDSETARTLKSCCREKQITPINWQDLRSQKKEKNNLILIKMKKLEKIRFGAHKMSIPEMKNTRGGIEDDAYCCTLICLAWHNGDDWSDGNWEGYNYGIGLCPQVNHCCYNSGTCDYVPC